MSKAYRKMIAVTQYARIRLRRTPTACKRPNGVAIGLARRPARFSLMVTTPKVRTAAV